MKPNHIIPENEAARKKWLSDLSRAIENFGPGAAFLAAQVTELENRCTAMRLGARDCTAKPNPGLVQTSVKTRFTSVSSFDYSLTGAAATSARRTAGSGHSSWDGFVGSVDSLLHLAMNHISTDIRKVICSMRRGATCR